jgi:hypothetical protein
METNNINCANCEKQFQEGFEFCPHCGQKAKDDLTLSVLFYNTISNYFSFDARFFKSFIPLMFKPGYVARKFIEGKRLQFLHPAQYYLFVSVIFFFLFSFTARKHTQAIDKALKQGFESKNIIPIDTIPKLELDSLQLAKMKEGLKKSQKVTGMSDEEIKALDSVMTNVAVPSAPNLTFDYDEKKVDSLIGVGASDSVIYDAMGMKEDAGFFSKMFYRQALKFQKNRGGGILQAFYDSIPFAMFFLLPIFAMLLKLFFWRRGRFSHHLVFSFYYFSFIFVVASIVFGVNLFTDIPDWIDWLVMLSTFIYLWIAIRRFYQQGYFVSFIKSNLVTFLYFIFVIPIAITVMFVASFVFY